MYNKLASWTASKHAFLLAREKIDSISLSQTHLTLLDQYTHEKAAMTTNMLASFKALGAKVLASKYDSSYGSYVYEHTLYKEPNYDHELPEKKQTLDSHLKDMDNHWDTLKSEEEERKRVLDDHLARSVAYCMHII